MIRLPPLTALRGFEAVARLGSVNAAADELNVTQSAISHQVRHLEDWFGFDLIERQGRGTRINATGLDLSRTLTVAFSDIADACRRISRADTALRLTVAAIPSLATTWLIPRLGDFWQHHPDISVSVVHALHGRKLYFSSCDLAIGYGTEDWPGLRTRLLLSGASLPVAAPVYLAEHRECFAPADLTRARLLHDSSHVGWQDWFSAAGVPRPDRMTGPIFEDFSLLRSSALAGHGVALCPPELLKQEIDSGQLRILFDVPVNDDRGYYILEPMQASPNPAVDTFRHWLTEIAELEREQTA